MTARVSDLIRADHREMRRLFAELTNPLSRPLTAPVVLALLAAHSRAEESEVYPVIRSETEATAEVEHSQEEHVEADRIAARLAVMDMNDEAFPTTLQELVKAVTHHMEEEEETVLPALDALPVDRQDALGKAFAAVRAEYLCAGVSTLTREELQQQARNEGKSGTSGMSKRQLVSEL